MSVRDRVTVRVRLSKPLLAAAMDQVNATRTNMNDVLVGILADRYRKAFVPSSRRGHPRGSQNVTLVMSLELKDTIVFAAVDPESMRGHNRT